MTRFTLAILFLAAGVVLIFGVVRPQWSGVSAERARIAELVLLNQELVALSNRRDELIRQYNAIPAADLAKLEAILPVRRDIYGPLADFETLSRRNGLVLERIDFPQAGPTPTGQLEPAAVRPAASAVPVTLELRGTYPAFRSFLAELESYQRLTDVTELRLSGSQDVYNFTVKGKMYYQR